MQTQIERIISQATDLGFKLIFALALLAVGIKLTKLLAKRLENARALGGLDAGLKKFSVNTVRVLLYTVVIISAAGILGIPYASFVAVLGSAGVAIGLALQGSLSNIAAGILILFNKPFKAGDFIEASGVSGTVTEIGFFATTIVTGDNKKISYPNSALSSSCITNYSAHETRRVDLVFSAAYECDAETVKEILIKTAEAEPLVLSDPKPFAGMSAHAESAVEYSLKVWCKTADYWTVYYSLNERVKKAFDENDIEIPYKKIDLIRG